MTRKQRQPAPHAADLSALRLCNGCGLARSYTVAVCPVCGNPEFATPPPIWSKLAQLDDRTGDT